MKGLALRAGVLAFVAGVPVMFVAPLLVQALALVARDRTMLALWALALGLAGSAVAGFLGATVGARAVLRDGDVRAVPVRLAAAGGATLLVLVLAVMAVLAEPAAVFVNGLAVMAAAVAAWFASGRAVRRTGRRAP